MSSRKTKKYVSLGLMGDLRHGVRELSSKTSPEHKAGVLFFVVLGAVLKGLLLSRPVSIAEANAYVDFATKSVGTIISDYSFPSNHIFQTLLMKLSTTLFGVGVVQIRLPDYIAGVLALPIFYVFVRAMFNRHIAILALVIVACSGPLISVGAMAVGFGVCWFFFTLSLLLGRYFIKSNDMKSVMFIALANALGLWTIPAYAYAALAIFIWLLIALIMAYTNSLRERLIRLVFAFIVFLLVALVLYAPILNDQGFDQLTNHHSHPRLDWNVFDLRHTDMSFNLWALGVDATSGWITAFGLIGLVYAAFVSSKLRALLFSLFIAGATLGLLMRRMEPPGVWCYTFYIFHLSSAISVFYLLKFLQEKVFPNWGKRSRTLVASLILAVLFGWTGLSYAWSRTSGAPEAEVVVAMIGERLRPGDKFYVQHPWDAPIEFLLLAQGSDTSVLDGPVATGGKVMVAVSKRPEQTVEAVLRSHGQDPARWNDLQMVREWSGLKIFAAP